MTSINGKAVRKLVIACDAGMGSSVMLATQLRRELRGQDVTVEHSAVDSIPGDADVVVCHAGLAERARHGAPGRLIVPFTVYIGDPAIGRVVAAIKDGGDLSG
ncbi:PTS lactose transporter subunit IIB [Actinomadura rubrisoli]|uniref:PTS lactose transporter subunit IIB n=1 Tax=Actinomadura rubrisoli TaxID=2530368 RepID=A0A4R5A0Y5_9ACTN|nr:PTS lactose transporter subunit IIB [Actinomadura rubrisoli]TDD65448.1 PTS lactose transporter subunit IIB [Actinomadura rubrisoli]